MRESKGTQATKIKIYTFQTRASTLINRKEGKTEYNVRNAPMKIQASFSAKNSICPCGSTLVTFSHNGVT